jgi:hypothetical protein
MENLPVGLKLIYKHPFLLPLSALIVIPAVLGLALGGKHADRQTFQVFKPGRSNWQRFYQAPHFIQQGTFAR